MTETDDKIVKDQEFMKKLKVAVTAKGPQHEDAEYSAGEFLTDSEAERYRENQRAKDLKKQIRQRKKRAAKEEQRFGGRIVLWSFEETKKKGKSIMEKKEAMEQAKETKTEKTVEKKPKRTLKMKNVKGKKKTATPKGKSQRRPRVVDGKITLLEKTNPKREKSKAYKRYELYRKHHTIASYLEAGGKRSSLRYDERHGFIKLSGVTTAKDKE